VAGEVRNPKEKAPQKIVYTREPGGVPVMGGGITEQLTRIADGDIQERREATEKLLEFTYKALHQIAEKKLRQERSRTRATRLVHDIVPDILRRRNRFNDRRHFFAWAKRQIDRIYVSQKRSECAESHGGAYKHVPLTPDVLTAAALNVDLRIDVERAIGKLSSQDRSFLAYLSEGYAIKTAAEKASIPVENAARRRQIIFAKLTALLDYGAHS